MRCISDEMIQKFVDKETSAKENSIVQSHLATCSTCAKRVEERRHTINRIKELMGSHNKNEIEIPVFQVPENQKKTVYTHFKKIAYIASAACLLILFLIFNQKSKDEIDFIYSYEVECEYNANLPLSEQEMVIEITDSDGKRLKY